MAGSEEKNLDIGIASSVLSFCPTGDECVEIMMVTLKNEGNETLEITPVSAIPVYGRGADRIRDHRHVTSLLNRTKVTEFGVTMTPSMSFDEKDTIKMTYHTVCAERMSMALDQMG